MPRAQVLPGVDGPTRGIATLLAALEQFDVHPAAPTHWATAPDDAYVFPERLAAGLRAGNQAR